MNHLIVSLNNNLEILGSSSNNIGARIIEKLYDLARTGLDNSSTLLGNLLVSKAYRDSVEWLNAHTGLNIVVSDSYYVRFVDPVFSQICSNSLGVNDVITETQANNLTNPKTILNNVTDSCNIVDMTPFENCVYFEADNDTNYTIHNCHLSVLNLGNIKEILDLGAMYGNFNQRLGTDLVIDTFIAEKLETIGVFGTRGVIYKEAYFPNLKYYGQAPGDSPSTVTINGTSYNYSKEFTFIGDKLQYWYGLGEGGHEEQRFTLKVVITATTPPVWTTYNGNDTKDNPTGSPGYGKYSMGSFCYYVPDSALNDYKTAPIWSNIWADWGTDCLKPISELPAEYKLKISKWYTEPTPSN